MNPTKRFSTRVENYIKYRPSYPLAILALLRDECGLTPDSVIADVGSGTGILTRLFLENGNRVFGIEPNDAMRAAGEALLRGYECFTSVAAQAEATTLPEASVELVVAGQAFHWFDHATARHEFARILKPGGWLGLVWNNRRTTGTPFLEGYEALLDEYSLDYGEVTHKEQGLEQLQRFFHPNPCYLATFENVQRFDFEGLRGRLLSSSYAPEVGHPNHAPMLAALRALFDAHQVEGTVSFDYDTEVFYGQLGDAPA